MFVPVNSKNAGTSCLLNVVGPASVDSVAASDVGAAYIVDTNATIEKSHDTFMVDYMKPGIAQGVIHGLSRSWFRKCKLYGSRHLDAQC